MADTRITMPALTLWQPWASLIARGVKTIETRSWPPPLHLLGERIAIHAAKKKPSRESMGYDKHWEADARDALGVVSLAELPLGAVVCTARLTRYAKVVRWRDGRINVGTKDEWIEPDRWGDSGIGRWLWFLEDIRPLSEPVRVAGGRGIWNWVHDPAVSA